MLDVLTAISLILLLIGHTFLIRGCFGIRAELPIQGGEIASKIERTGDLLDEVAQLIADLGDGGGVATSMGITQKPAGIGDLLTMFLNNRMNMGGDDASQNQEWEIYQEDNPQEVQA